MEVIMYCNMDALGNVGLRSQFNPHCLILILLFRSDLHIMTVHNYKQLLSYSNVETSVFEIAYACIHTSLLACCLF